MATLKVKKVKSHEYYYWSKSVRSHKKFGGDGRVRSIDLLIGTDPLGQWLSYYLWTKEVALEEYAEAVVKHLCPRDWEPFVDIRINWGNSKPKVSIASVIRLFEDCRSRYWRQQRQELQTWVDRIVQDSTAIDRLIQDAAYLLGEHYRHSKKAEKWHERAHKARLFPDDFAPGAEGILDESAHAIRCLADQAMQRHLKYVQGLEKLAPPKSRQQFRYQVISRAEKLAQDHRWLEEYQVKLERNCHSAS